MSSPAPKTLDDDITSTQFPNSSVDSKSRRAVETLDQDPYQPKDVGDDGDEGGGGDGEEEGGFCVFMKGGGCRDSFIAWEDCIKEAELNSEDSVDKCADVTAALWMCMDSHADYYGPVLRAQKAIDEAAEKVLVKDHEPEVSHGQETADSVEGDGGGDTDEDEAESGLRLFMEGGECRDKFVAWENCIKEAEVNREKIFDKCFDVTAALKKCVDAHSKD